MNDLITRRLFLGATLIAVPGAVLAARLLPQAAEKVAGKVPDRLQLLEPNAVRLNGFLGERCQKNERARLLAKDEDELLGGFRQRPGRQAWVGEHVGKWLHAATLAWVYTGDAEMRTKLDRVAAGLIATQQPDGYLGTYADGRHFEMGKNEQWDVWVHKYDLMGLVTYARYTGNTAALEAARKVGDLLVKTFGPGGLDLNERSTHVGMASGSVLEPLVLLYRATGEAKYLDFARSLVERWETGPGPRLISTLLEKRSVKATANAKAYEMLSCLVGLCELYRATGEAKYLAAVRIAWDDVAQNQLLITGSGSSKEHWTEPHQYLSESRTNVAETCVTVTWIQLTQQLLRLTGEARYADELEKTFYNHLAAAQRPDGAAWSYFTAHDGIKPYKSEQNCCTSSGPRGWAMLPTFAYLKDDDAITVNFFTPSTAQVRLKGQAVTIKQETEYPSNGRVKLTVTVPVPLKFALRVRVPAWSSLSGMSAKAGEYWVLRQTWSRTQTVVLDFAVPVRAVKGEGGSVGRVAVVRGPQVLAVDEHFNPGLAPNSVALAEAVPALKTSLSQRDADGMPIYETEGVVTRDTESHKAGDRVTLCLSPYASASGEGQSFAVWLAQSSVTPRP